VRACADRTLVLLNDGAFAGIQPAKAPSFNKTVFDFLDVVIR
jgi:hypothetical protein